jgi:DNA-binding MarR family transcriptional regulator
MHESVTCQPPCWYCSDVGDLAGLGEADWTVWRGFVAVRRSVDRALEQRLQADAGISTADFDVLHALGKAEGHRLRAGALAETVGWEKSRISHQVSRMTARGLLERVECSADARGTWVVLAPAGADALAAATCGYVEVLQETFFGPLGAADKRALKALADRMLGAERERDRPAPVPA